VPTHQLVIVGSANRDYTVVVDRHPRPGETIIGGLITAGTGGKGANQAVAAARFGARPIFLAAIGRDSNGDELVADLETNGVDVSRIQRQAVPTGVAFITVSKDGENSIVVSAGANELLLPETIVGVLETTLMPGDVVLCQLEIPLPTVIHAAEAAEESGARFILNLSPYQIVPSNLLAVADPVVVNLLEAIALSGTDGDPARAAKELLVESRSVVITLGEKGVIVADHSEIRMHPARSVRVVDTTGAGDAFAGVLAAALASGLSLSDAVECGIDAGAAAVQYVGAQPAKPSSTKRRTKGSSR
jgi:ribokinase